MKKNLLIASVVLGASCAGAHPSPPPAPAAPAAAAAAAPAPKPAPAAPRVAGRPEIRYYEISDA